jgi:hypothetical protein
MDMSGSYRALAWGPGTGLDLTNPHGIDSLPPARISDVDRPLADGAWSARARRSGRDLQWGYRITASTIAAFDALALAINGAARSPTDTELAANPKGFPLLFDGGAKQVFAWLRDDDIPRTVQGLQQLSDLSIRYFCPDPLKYSSALHTASTGLGTATGGLIFPATFPATFGSGSAGGQVQVTNAGTTDTPPLLTITGPVDNPIIDHVELGRSLQFSLSLITGDSLVLDADTRTAVLNGQANRENTLTLPQWFYLTPGVNSIRYRNNGAFSSSQLTVSFRDAWL